jgi:hypothetical protein
MVEIFPDAPQCKRLHIIIQPRYTRKLFVSLPPNSLNTDLLRVWFLVPVVPHIPLVAKRLAYLQKAVGAPSAGAKPASFAATQEKEEYLCNRPRGAADSLPVTLLEPIFAEFVDDCQDYQPTDEDNNFVRKLSEDMSSFYTEELVRMNAFRQLLRGYGITLDSSAISSTDGHLLSPNGNFVQVIVEGKNEIGSGGAEPFMQAMLYYRKILKESNVEIAKFRSVLPCIHIIVFG